MPVPKIIDWYWEAPSVDELDFNAIGKLLKKYRGQKVAFQWFQTKLHKTIGTRTRVKTPLRGDEVSTEIAVVRMSWHDIMMVLKETKLIEVEDEQKCIGSLKYMTHKWVRVL